MLNPSQKTRTKDIFKNRLGLVTTIFFSEVRAMTSAEKLAREQIEQRRHDKAKRTCRHCGFVAHCPRCLMDHIHKEHGSAIRERRAQRLQEE